MTQLEQSYAERRLKVLIPIAERLEQFLRDCLSDQPRIDRISVRAKDVDRFIEKAAKKIDGRSKYSDPLNQIQDQIGARVVTFYVEDVPRISNMVEKYFRPIEFKDIVPDSESEFGYFGKHYIMLIPMDVIHEDTEDSPPFFELQIKTLFQHAWSEANHDLGYKQEGNLTPEQKRKMAFTSAQAWGADLIFNELFKELQDDNH